MDLSELDDAEGIFTSQSKCSKEIEKLKFVTILEKYGKVLLDKSQTPSVKIKKKAASETMCIVLMEETGENYTPEKVIKKIANFKQRVKSRVEMVQTGTSPNDLREYEKIFLSLMGDSNSRSSLNAITIKDEIEIEEPNLNPKFHEVKMDEISNSDFETELDEIALNKISVKKANTSELRESNNKLQKDVLDKQMDLIKRQREMFETEEKRKIELHNHKMKVQSLKMEVLNAKLSFLKQKCKCKKS